MPMANLWIWYALHHLNEEEEIKKAGKNPEEVEGVIPTVSTIRWEINVGSPELMAFKL